MKSKPKKLIKRDNIVHHNHKILGILKVKNNLRIQATQRNLRTLNKKRKEILKETRNNKLSKNSKGTFKM
jgi:hypothetical protein